MNKILFEKVNAKCKDRGLSEKYLKAITEKLGGSIEDDSTDEAAIEKAANQIAEVAAETQSEATRWASKKDPEKGKGKEKEDDPKPKEEKEGKNNDSGKAPIDEVKALKDKLAELEGKATKAEREAAIKAAQAKHKIPDWRMKGVMVPDDQDPDTYLAEIKQDLIAQKLVPGDAEGVKAATEKQVDQAADALLESITVK